LHHGVRRLSGATSKSQAMRQLHKMYALASFPKFLKHHAHIVNSPAKAAAC